MFCRGCDIGNFIYNFKIYWRRHFLFDIFIINNIYCCNKFSNNKEIEYINFPINSKEGESITFKIKSKYCGKLIIQAESLKIYDYLTISSVKKKLNKSKEKLQAVNTVLNKEGKLDDEEWEAMKKHPSIGAAIPLMP